MFEAFSMHHICCDLNCTAFGQRFLRRVTVFLHPSRNAQLSFGLVLSPLELCLLQETGFPGGPEDLPSSRGGTWLP